MLLKICLLGLGLAMLVTYHPAAAVAAAVPQPQPETQGAEETLSSVPFETSHKHPDAAALSEEGFHTAHRISVRATDAADYSMNLLPTKERPELNPVLSALINEDVMKSIEAKRAIEEEELAEVRREIEEAALAELAQRVAATEAPVPQLTTLPAASKKIDSLDEDVVVDPHDEFVNQNFALESAGSENNKKSRIEIKKGPNGQDYEYEYVYYYEEDDDAAAAPAKPSLVEAAGDPETRGKTRYTNIERSTPASPSENSLQSGKAKGRSSSSVGEVAGEDIELERLPVNTRFPSRGKNIEVPPTPALDSLETAAERKKISVKRPSLELVDSETFNTDEKQQKGSRNGDNELKPVIAVEQEAAAAAAKERELKKEQEQKKQQQEEQQAQDELAGITDEVEQTTPSMEKAALDLYAILTNENLNNEQTTSADGTLDDATTLSPDTASTDEDDGSLTTLQDELSSSSSTTTSTTTTTTTEAPTTSTTTTTTTAAPTLYGGRRSGLNGLAGRNRFKLNREGGAAAGAAVATSTTSTTETPATEATKTGRNRFSRPSIGGRSRPGARTTASPESSPAPAAGAEEEAVVAKEVKPVSSGFARGRPRNRFNLRGSTTSTTTERSAEEAGPADGSASPDAVSSTTARSSLRGRPGLGLRGRSRTTTTKAPAAEGSSADEAATSEEGKPAAAAAAAPAASPAEGVRPSRFNLHRAGGNRLLPRGKLGRAGVSTEAPKAEAAEDSAADSTSHHNDVKGAVEAAEGAEKTEGGDAAAAAPAGPVSGFNRLKNRPRLNALHKTDAAKPKAAAGAGAAPSPAAVAPRKINPLLAKRRLQLGGAAAAAATSTTELPAEEEHASSDGDASGEHKEEANAGSEESGSDSAAAKDQDTTEAAETTTKQQARGLGLLGQRRRLPLRKPGTIL